MCKEVPNEYFFQAERRSPSPSGRCSAAPRLGSSGSQACEAMSLEEWRSLEGRREWLKLPEEKSGDVTHAAHWNQVHPDHTCLLSC